MDAPCSSKKRTVKRLSYWDNVKSEEPAKKKRKVMTQEGRALIVNVYNYLKEEYLFTMMYKDCRCDLSHLQNIARRTADATNITLRTLAQILHEAKDKGTYKKKDYKFVKNPEHTVPVVDPEKLRQELEEMEAKTLAEAIDEEDPSLPRIEVIKVIPVEINKEVDSTIGNREPVENEIDVKEEITWEEVEVKTEAEDEINLQEIEVKEEVEEATASVGDEIKTEVEDGINLKVVEIKGDAYHYEIVIDEDRIG